MSDGDGDDEQGQVSTGNTMRERSDESSLKLLLLLGVDRALLTAGFALVVFVGFMLFAVVLDPSLQSEIRTADTIETMFSTMISVIVTGATLVVTISQLVLSQENGPLGDQRKRMSDAMDFRTYTKDLLGGVVPADPSTFLRALVKETERRAEVVDRIVADSGNADLEREVGEFIDSVHGNAKQVEDDLDGASFGTFDVLFAALNFNYSWKIYQIERLTADYGDDLDDDQMTAFDDLRTALSMFGPAREHVKTLYFEWALVDLSRYIIYAAIPALVVAGGMLGIVGAETFGPTRFLGLPVVTWVVGVAFTITLIPFLIFVSYILRVATVAKRTLAIGPLILRDSQR